MPQITKLASIAGTTLVASGIAATTAGILPGIKAPKEIVIKNISERLSHKGFEVLDTEQDSDDWKAVLKSYHTATKYTFKDGGGEDKQRNEQSLREECKKQLALNTDESYKLARKWCVKEQSVTEILSKKHTILTTTDSKPEETAIWGEKFTNLWKTTEAKFSAFKAKVNIVGANEEILKKECAALKPNDIKTTGETFGDVFEKTREFCSKRNTK